MKVILSIILALFVTSSIAASYSGVSQIPLNDRNKIKNIAKRQWPNDYEMQEYVINKQEEAYRQILKYTDRDLPFKVFNELKRKASLVWPMDYEMRLYYIDQQAASYKAVNK